MHQNVSRLDRGVMIGVGAAFRFLIGDISTPPQIFQKMGLQWLFRMVEELCKHPRTYLKVMRARGILTSKLEFIIKFPHEVNAARQQLKTLHPRKRQQNVER